MCSPALSPGKAALVAYGRAYGNPDYGMILYQASHTFQGGTVAQNTAAARTLGNLLAAGRHREAAQHRDQHPRVPRWAGQTVDVSAVVSGGTPPYAYSWTSSCGGTFADPTAASTTFTAPIVATAINCNITVEVWDSCNRLNFAGHIITVVPNVPKLTLVKSVTETSYDSVGDVLHYSYLLTNSGNVTLSTPFTVTDDKANDEACPATPTSLAPGESITCTASYTITQADLDAGSVKNTAQGHGNYGTTPVNSNYDDETVTAVQTPLLSITKVATEQSFTAVGNILHYTIVAKNIGNVTLAAVTVSDSLVSNLSCAPTNGSALAKGASMTCTATHMVTQADLAAKHWANTACVDDGAAGAGQVCADEDVPWAHLTITKVATETSYMAVGNILHYTIVATNDGGADLAAVTVTDTKVTGLSCAPTNGSALVKGASMTCTATHTVTQADLDAGHWANTACVDDGAGGAGQACADEDVPWSSLTITKVATEQSFTAVGNILHYTIVATNGGNADLAAVTVTDTKVTGLSCAPTNGSALAKGTSMTCTATHTVTQADLDAKHWANTACVDDGAGGAARSLCGRGRAVGAPDDHEGGHRAELHGGGEHPALHRRSDQRRRCGPGGGDGERFVGQRPELCAGQRFGAVQGCVDDVHGDAHGDAGGPRCQALGQHGLCR